MITRTYSLRLLYAEDDAPPPAPPARKRRLGPPPKVDTLQRGVQWMGGAVDGGSMI